MLASERRVTTTVANGIKNPHQHHPGVCQILKPGRAVKIYVIDPRKFQERLEKYVGDFKKSDSSSAKETEIGISTECLKTKGGFLHIAQQSKTDEKRQKDFDFSTKITTSNNNTITIDVEEDVSSNSDKQLQKNGDGSTAVTPSSYNEEKSSNSGQLPDDKPKKVPKKKSAKKRKAAMTKNVRRGSNLEEKAEAAELAFLMKETTTRTGRISKSSTASAAAATTTTPVVIGISQPASPAGSVFSLGLNSSVPPSPSPSLASVNSQGQQRVKKREPPEMFRCQTCLKVYLGHTKLNLHFQKFPTHQKSDASPVLKKKTKTAVIREQNINQQEGTTTTTDGGNFTNVNSDSINNNNNNNLSNSFFPIQEVPNISRNTVQIQTDPIPLETNYNQQHQHHHQPRINEGRGEQQALSTDLNTFASITGSSKSSRCTIINPDTLSDNCSSPKLSNFSLIPPTGENVNSASESVYNNHVSTAAMDPIFIQTDSPVIRRDSQQEELLQPITVPDNLPDHQCLSSDVEERSTRTTNEYFMEFQSDFNTHSEISQIPSELIGNGSCSQQSFNSLENLLADSNSQILHPSPQPSPVGGIGGGGSGRDESLSPCTSGRTTFFPTSTKRRQTYKNSSSYANGSIPPPIVVDEESRDTCIISRRNNVSIEEGHGAESSLDGCETSPQPCLIKRKSIWEFVKEQIRLCGINQTCGEISEMADKLSKVARDKFYPIREEEIERLGVSPPVIHVDSPFISHLLDLPFGSYIFKEDGGIRKIIPPPTPVSSDLSLTGGVEVDIDNFLSPDIDDLISLPHLTNLDFASICNE